MGAQEHFYMETQAGLIQPGKEDDEITAIVSTQNPTEMQQLIAEMIPGLAMNKVTVKAKRLGGKTKAVF